MYYLLSNDLHSGKLGLHIWVLSVSENFAVLKVILFSIQVNKWSWELREFLKFMYGYVHVWLLIETMSANLLLELAIYYGISRVQLNEI